MVIGGRFASSGCKLSGMHRLEVLCTAKGKNAALALSNSVL